MQVFIKVTSAIAAFCCRVCGYSCLFICTLTDTTNRTFMLIQEHIMCWFLFKALMDSHLCEAGVFGYIHLVWLQQQCECICVKCILFQMKQKTYKYRFMFLWCESALLRSQRKLLLQHYILTDNGFCRAHKNLNLHVYHAAKKKKSYLQTKLKTCQVS